MRKNNKKGKKSEASVDDIIKNFLEPNSKSPIPGDPDFKLSLEELQEFRNFVRENFGANAVKYIRYIDKCQLDNLDLPDNPN